MASCAKCNVADARPPAMTTTRAKSGTAPLQCGRCKTTSYCSKECQRLHWKDHKSTCLTRKEQKMSRAMARETTVKDCNFCNRTPKDNETAFARCMCFTTWRSIRVSNGRSLLQVANCGDVYRLYQDDNVLINAKVSATSQEIQEEIIHATANIGGFLRGRELFICHSIPIRWDNDACLSISFSRNPQIQNGIRLSGTDLKGGTGLLTRNYRAKFFRLPNIYNKTIVSIPTGCKRPFTKRGIVGTYIITEQVNSSVPGQYTSRI